MYDWAWAVNLIEAAGRSLEEECRLAGKAGFFEQLKVFLSGDQSHLTYADVGARLRLRPCGGSWWNVRATARRHGGGLSRVDLENVDLAEEANSELLLVVDEALTKLNEVDPRRRSW